MLATPQHSLSLMDQLEASDFDTPCESLSETLSETLCESAIEEFHQETPTNLEIDQDLISQLAQAMHEFNASYSRWKPLLSHEMPQTLNVNAVNQFNLKMRQMKDLLYVIQYYNDNDKELDAIQLESIQSEIETLELISAFFQTKKNRRFRGNDESLIVKGLNC